jgi:tight adherence protein B
MSTPAWLALAVAVALCAVPAVAPMRVGTLAGSGRLAGVASERAGRPAIGARWRKPVTGFVAAAVLAIGIGGGPLLGVAAAVVALAAWLLARDVLVRRDSSVRRAQLLAALRVLISELEAGARPSAALAAAGDAAPRHASTFAAASAAAGGAHDAGAVLRDDPQTRLVGLAWQLGEDTGLALADVLARVAADLAAADEQRRTVAVALAGPRSSAGLLTGLPLLGIALGAAMGVRPLQFLIGPGTGRAVCCVGVLLDVAGVLWMRRILRRAERT